jgi:vancomycin permeability regulator SanA
VTIGSSPSIKVVIIMGAAVWPGGVPSNAMRRRVQGAFETSRGLENVLFLPTGGVGNAPPAEAQVMRELLIEMGVASSSILVEEVADDTLSSVRLCAGMLKTIDNIGEIYVCSDTYHMPRCRWLFRLCGVRTLAGRVESGRSYTGTIKWAGFYVREIAAVIWDTFLVLALKRPGNKTA